MCLEYFQDCLFSKMLESIFSNLKFQAIYIWGHGGSTGLRSCPGCLHYGRQMSYCLLVSQSSRMPELLFLIHVQHSPGTSQGSTPQVQKRQVMLPGHTGKIHVAVSPLTKSDKRWKKRGIVARVLQRNRTNGIEKRERGGGGREKERFIMENWLTW